MLNKNPQSPQSLVLRFMREKRKLTITQVSKTVGLKAKKIDFLENGRGLISENEILNFLKCYDYSQDLFNEMIKIKPLNKQTANHYFLNM